MVPWPTLQRRSCCVFSFLALPGYALLCSPVALAFSAGTRLQTVPYGPAFKSVIASEPSIGLAKCIHGWTPVLRLTLTRFMRAHAATSCRMMVPGRGVCCSWPPWHDSEYAMWNGCLARRSNLCRCKRPSVRRSCPSLCRVPFGLRMLFTVMISEVGFV